MAGQGGFDALGQVEYYAGITPLFHNWKKGGKPPVVLHILIISPRRRSLPAHRDCGVILRSAWRAGSRPFSTKYCTSCSSGWERCSSPFSD